MSEALQRKETNVLACSEPLLLPVRPLAFPHPPMSRQLTALSLSHAYLGFGVFCCGSCHERIVMPMMAPCQGLWASNTGSWDQSTVPVVTQGHL